MKNIKLIDFFVDLIFLLIIFLIPIYFGVFFSSNSVFDFHKLILFKFLLFPLILLSFIKFIFQNNFLLIFSELFKKYFYLPIIIVVFSLISITWSVDQKTSFYGSYDEQMGWLNLLYFFIFFILLTLNLVFSENKSKKINLLLKSLILSSIIVAVYAVVQFFGYDFLIWSDKVNKAVFSTIGSSFFSGLFLLLIIPLSFYFLSIKKSIGSRIYYFVSLFFQLLGLLVLSVNFFVNEKNFFSKGYLWRNSVGSVFKKFWGYGLENQQDAILNLYQSSQPIFNKINLIPNRFYNIIFDHIFSIGIVGLIIWICFYLFVFRVLSKNIANNKNKILSRAIFWSLGIYLFSIIFSFDIVVTTICFWFFVAIAISINFDTEQDVEISLENKHKIFKSILFVLFLPLVIVGINREFKNLKIDYYYLETKRFFYQNEIPASLLTFSYLKKENPIYNKYNYEFIGMIFDNFSKFKDRSSQFLAVKEVEKILEELNADKKNNSFEHYLVKAQALSLVNDFDNAEKLFNILEEKSPYYPYIYYKKARMYFLQSDFLSAVVNYKKVLSLLPDENNLKNKSDLKYLLFYKNIINKEISSIEILINNN